MTSPPKTHITSNNKSNNKEMKMPHYKHPVDPNGYDVVPQGFSLPEIFQRIGNDMTAARNAKEIA